MKALEAKWGRGAALAAVGSFLVVDLVLFGNCIIPTRNALPVPVEPGKYEASASTVTPLLVPMMGGVELRKGTAGESDIGFHAFLEFLPEGSFLGGVSDSASEKFVGGENIGFGFDRKTVLSRKGDYLQAFQYGVFGHYNLTSAGPAPAMSVMAGLLTGKEWGYLSPRVHLGWQRTGFMQLELPMGLQLNAFNRRLGIELGLNPSILLAQGAETIPWPWQHLVVRWRFGG